MTNFIGNIIDWCYRVCVRGGVRNLLPLQTFRYAAVGGGNLVLSWILYWTIYNFVIAKRFIPLGFVTMSPYVATFLVVFAVTFFTGYWLQKNITFTNSPLRNGTQMFRYFVSVTGSVVINYLLLKFFVECLGVYPTPSQMLSSLVTIVYSYFMQHHFSFRGHAAK